MKKITALFILLLLPSLIYSQMFQKITNQPLVQDNGYGSGCAWGDYNNDGKLDMIVTSYNDFGATTYPQLYKNMGSGNFQLQTSNTIMTNSLFQTLACAWGDYNYDGKMDIYIATGMNQPDLLYKNIGGGNFERITSCLPLQAGHSGGICWADYNRDGYLDVLSVQHGTNLLYKGTPNGQFEQVTTGPVVTDNGNHRRACWGDYNNDKYPDLFVVNGNNEKDNLYLNNKNGTFTKITTGDIVNDFYYGSGCSWGDYNNDGWLDLYVTNSGKNFLYKNNKNGTFTKITTGAIVNDEDNSFGCNWGDYDNDGDLDMFVANNQLQKNCLYRNDGGDNFTKITGEIVANEVSSSVGASWGDYNNDGKLDLFVVNQGYGGPSENDFLYKNTGASPWYLMIRFIGGGIGTRVKLKIGNYTAIREVSGGNSCSSQDMPWVHFGLGFLGDNPASTVDSVIVDWNDGYSQTLTNVALNQEIEFFGVVGVQQTGSEVPASYSLSQNYPNPFNPSTTIKYDIVKEGNVKISIFDLSGKEVETLIDGVQNAGSYSAAFNASKLSSGVYFYKIQTADFTDTKKMILVK
jgi:hypothetical protein